MSISGVTSLCLTHGNLDGFECVSRYLRGEPKGTRPSHTAGAGESSPEAGGDCPQFSELEAATSLYVLGGKSQPCDIDSPLSFVEGQGVNIFCLRSSVSTIGIPWLYVVTLSMSAYICCS